jgi:hypothetical protein
MTTHALSQDEQKRIERKFAKLEKTDISSKAFVDKLTNFIRREFNFSELRAVEIVGAYIRSRRREVDNANAIKMRKLVTESFPGEQIPSLRFFVMLQSVGDDGDLPPLNSLKDVRNEVGSLMQAMRLSMRWLNSRRCAFARHPEFDTMPELEAFFRDRYQCETPAELQRAIERDNENV